MVDYHAWHCSIREKLARHIASNLNAYPFLKKKFAVFQAKGTDLLLEMLLFEKEPFKYLKEDGVKRPG